MGNCTSRNIFQTKGHGSHPSQTCSSNQTFDQQRFNKLHMDTHYDVIDKVLNHHLILMNSNTDTEQRAVNIHKNAVNIAVRNHINAAHLKSPNYQQTQ
jgi:hypothetical protein